MGKRIIVGLLAAFSCFAQTAVYPNAVVTDNQLKVGVNAVAILLTGTITSSQTLFSVSACGRITANVLITIDQEIMPVTGCSGTTLVEIGRAHV